MHREDYKSIISDNHGVYSLEHLDVPFICMMIDGSTLFNMILHWPVLARYLVSITYALSNGFNLGDPSWKRYDSERTMIEWPFSFLLVNTQDIYTYSKFQINKSTTRDWPEAIYVERETPTTKASLVLAIVWQPMGVFLVKICNVGPIHFQHTDF